MILQNNNIPKIGIAVDAGMYSNPCTGFYQGVDIATGEVLFEYIIKHETTNNIAEFIAICHAVAFRENSIKEFGKVNPIYSDSQVALKWAREGYVNTSISSAESDTMIKHCLETLERCNTENINKWQTKLWGEIPADFGRK